MCIRDRTETEPYFYTLQIMIAGILGHMQGGIEHQYFDERPEIKEADRKKGYIVVTADKGLAGGYNHNAVSYTHLDVYKRQLPVCLECLVMTT